MMFKRTVVPLTLCLITSLPLISHAEIDEKTREEIDFLKEEIIVLQDQLEEINIGSANRMSISGYTDLEYKTSDQDGVEPGFRLHHMSLFFDKRLSDEWKFFSEIEYEDGPFSEFDFSNTDTESPCKGCSGKIFLEAVNFTYRWMPQVNLRGGRFFTPAGIWSVDHYPPFVATQTRPQHIRKIFPQVIDGLTALGTLQFGSTFLNYDVYVGNGEGNSGKKDQNSEKSLGIKLSMVFPALEYVELGATVYSDTLNDNTDKQATGAHLKIRFADFTLQSEYALADLEPSTTAAYKQTGYYIQLLYNTTRMTYGIRHDYYDADDRDDEETTNNTMILNYHVSESIVLKLEHNLVENQVAKDYQETIGSIVIYLGN